ncbi:hypothetical protein [Caulobacter sp. RHG1]|uniref:hypothetical protein n=1 Tax=Caulobacter sp. (strain RHG1) TaxID=2545762 RepID=UPI0015538E64|nr:hypothetical protein [Caulobacter sp. RHG1]NQE64528.1 hypothetical protein [Caulobacter sp. RHG1]
MKARVNWMIGAVWLAFVVAVLMSNFFIIANNIGMFAAIEAGAILGPMKHIIDVPCDTSGMVFVPCDPIGHDEPLFTIPLKLLLILALVATFGLSYWMTRGPRAAEKLAT